MPLDKDTEKLIDEIADADKLIEICGESGLFMYDNRRCYLMNKAAGKVNCRMRCEDRCMAYVENL